MNRINGASENIDEESFQCLIRQIWAAPRVFICGSGRSGKIGEMFAMRLVHIRKVVYIVGAPTTPSIGKGDLLITISGSGTTKLVLNCAKTAKRVGAKVMSIRLAGGNSVDDHISKISDRCIVLDRRLDGEKRKNYLEEKFGVKTDYFPLGSSFEISALLFLETTIGALIEGGEIHEEILKETHTNLE